MPEEILNKFCYKCKTEKLASEFYAFRPTQCRSCIRVKNVKAKRKYNTSIDGQIKNRQYRVSHAEKVREWSRLSAQRCYQKPEIKLYQAQYRRSQKGKEIQKRCRQKKKKLLQFQLPVLSLELICTRCRTTKSSSEFYRSPYRRSGFGSWCKFCCRLHILTKGKDARKKASRKYALKMRKYLGPRSRSKASQAAHNYRQKYRSNPENRQKILARLAVNNAVIAGRLFKPKLCSICGLEKRITGHHWSYLRENWLDVQWLCHRCHEAIHHPIVSDQQILVDSPISLVHCA